MCIQQLPDSYSSEQTHTVSCCLQCSLTYAAECHTNVRLHTTLNFNCRDFCYSSSFGVAWPSKSECLLTRSQPACRTRI